MKKLIIAAFLFFSFTCQADSETFDFTVEFGANGKNVSIKAAPATGYLTGLSSPLQGKQSFEDEHSSTYGGGDSPFDEKPRKPGGRGGYSTTLIESWSWQPLYISNQIVGFLLSLTVDKNSLSGFTTSWKPVIGALVAGWVARTIYSQEQPLFNRMDAQQSGESHLAIITCPKAPRKSETVAVSGTESGTSGSGGGSGGRGSGKSVTISIHGNDGNSGDQPPQTFYHTRDMSCPHPHCNNGRCIEVRVEGGQTGLVDSQVCPKLFKDTDMAQFALTGIGMLNGNEAAENFFIEAINASIINQNISVEAVFNLFMNAKTLFSVSSRVPDESRGGDLNSAGLSLTAQSKVMQLKNAVKILKNSKAGELLRYLVSLKANTTIQELIDVNRNDPGESFKNKVIEVARIIRDANESYYYLNFQMLDTGVNIIQLADEFSTGESWLVNEIQWAKETIFNNLNGLGLNVEKCSIAFLKDFSDGDKEKFALQMDIARNNFGAGCLYYFFSKLDTKDKFMKDHMIDMQLVKLASAWHEENKDYTAVVCISMNADDCKNSYVVVEVCDKSDNYRKATSDTDKRITYVNFIDRVDGEHKANYKGIFRILDELKRELESDCRCIASAESGEAEVP